MPKFKRIILSDGKTKLERISDSPEVIEANRKLCEERIKIQKEQQKLTSREKTIKRLSSRFWEKVDKKGEDECWNWLGMKDKDGYGMIYNTYSLKAHRFMYELVHGEISKEKPFITHSCNNPSCVNPKHLESGTSKSNMEYRSACGRTFTANGNLPMTLYKVNEMRKRYQDDKSTTITHLSKEFNISLGEASLIIRNEVWIDLNYIPKIRSGFEGQNHPNSLLTWKEVKEIREKYSTKKYTYQTLAKEYNVKYGVIWDIIDGRRWFDENYVKPIF